VGVTRGSVLVTGGSGYLGCGLVPALLAAGWERVCVYSRGEHRQAELREALRDDARVRWFIGDVRDVVRLERACSGVGVVLHCAALKRIEVGALNPDEMVKTNVLGAMNVVEACARARVRVAVLVSSDKAYEPVSPYGQTKALAESLFLTAKNVHPGGPRYVVVRYGNVFGSTGSIVPLWRGANGSAVMTDGECTRFFMTRRQAVSLIMGAMAGEVELTVPELPAYRLGDLAVVMGVRPRVIGLRDFEKRHESMCEGRSSDRARRMSVAELREALDAVESA
jgi:UDP-N-acetylglucosamine 4,6-dehydratase/5-epimerase